MKRTIDRVKMVESTLFQGDGNIVLNVDTLIWGDRTETSIGRKSIEDAYRRIEEISCDRKEVIEEFKAALAAHGVAGELAPFYFFVLPSFQEQQGNSMIERLTELLREIYPANNRHNFPYDNRKFKIRALPSSKYEGQNRDDFSRELCRLLNIPIRGGNDFSLQHFDESESAHRSDDIVSISYAIKASDLDQKHMIEFLHWIMTRCSVRRHHKPPFVFFLMIDIPNNKASGVNRYLPFLQSPYNRKLKDLFDEIDVLKNAFKGFEVLPPLGSIRIAHVSDALAHRVTNEEKRYNMIRELLGKKFLKMSREEIDLVSLPMSKGELIVTSILNKIQHES